MPMDIKNHPLKNRRVHVTYVDEVPDGSGWYLGMSMSNDLLDPEDSLARPMLVYHKRYDDVNAKDKSKDEDVKETLVTTSLYTRREYETILEKSNKEGDGLVFNANIITDKSNTGVDILRVDTNSIQTPTEPFDSDDHVSNTMAIRRMTKDAETQSAYDTLTQNQDRDRPIDVPDKIHDSRGVMSRPSHARQDYLDNNVDQVQAKKQKRIVEAEEAETQRLKDERANSGPAF